MPGLMPLACRSHFSPYRPYCYPGCIFHPTTWNRCHIPCHLPSSQWIVLSYFFPVMVVGLQGIDNKFVIRDITLAVMEDLSCRVRLSRYDLIATENVMMPSYE